MPSPGWLYGLLIVFVSVTRAQYTAPRYGVCEIELTGSEYDNPYTSVTLDAQFSGPGNANITLPGFWKGGTTWAVRFSPPLVGSWTFSITSNDPLIDQQSGSVECTSSTHSGFLQIQGRHFFYDDGSPFFRMGDTCWRMFRSKNAAFETHFKPYIDARAAQGFNFISGVIHTVQDPSINEGGSLWENDSDLDRLQPPYFDWVDARIEYMLQKNIIPGLLFVWAQTFDDFTSSQFERFAKYIVARYAAYNVVWVVSGEYNETSTPQVYDYFGGLIDYWDPYDHPLSIHPTGYTSNSKDLSLFSDWLDYIMQQMYGDAQALYDSAMTDRPYGLPVCVDEYGYEGPQENSDPFYHHSNQTKDQIRKDSWAIAMANSYLMYGCIYTCTAKEKILQTDKLNTPGALELGHLKSFFTQTMPFHECVPQPSRASSGGLCIQRNLEWAIYLPDSHKVNFDLSDQSGYYKLEWLEPETGSWSNGGALPGGAVTRIYSPFSKDALVKVTQTSDPLLSFRLWLQGAYASSKQEMSDSLYQKDLLPVHSPYPQASITQHTIPEQAVDWVLLELTLTPDGEPVVQESVFIDKNGFSMNRDANSAMLRFKNLAPSSYYIRITHRNHCQAISAEPVLLQDYSTVVYDFTLGQDQFYDRKTAVDIDGTRWAIKGADINRDNIINTMDYRLWYNVNRDSTVGYLDADTNMDGKVDVSDYNLWMQNASN